MDAVSQGGSAQRMERVEGKVLALEVLNTGLEGKVSALTTQNAELQAKVSLLERMAAEVATVKETMSHLEQLVCRLHPAPGDQSQMDDIRAPHQHLASNDLSTLPEAGKDAAGSGAQMPLHAKTTEGRALKRLRVSLPRSPALAVLDQGERETTQVEVLRLLRRRVVEDSFEADKPFECAPCFHFFVGFVSKGEIDSASLGIYVETSEDRIVISHIKTDGHISRWNETHPERRVMVQDEIIEVNGVRLLDVGAWKLKEMLKDTGEFRLKLRRNNEACKRVVQPNVVRRGILKQRQT